MPEEVKAFLKTERVCVLAVEMPDGSPHAATVHFAYLEDSGTFVFETNRNYKKSEALFGKKLSRASLATGFEEGPTSRTFQTDGTVHLLGDEESSLQKGYLQKFPEKEGKISQTEIFFAFVPTWWRFTDWTKPEGKTILNSDGSVIVAKPR